MNKLKELRLKTGKTIQQVSKELGISANYLSQIERDERPITRKLMPLFCDYYKVRPNELLEYDDFILINETTNEFSKKDIEMLRLIKQMTDKDKDEMFNFLSYLIWKHEKNIEAMRNDKKGN